MKCSACPVKSGALICLGESVERLCVLSKTREDYRRQLVRLAAEASDPPAARSVELDDVLAAVAVCPHRGGVLPVSLQPECGCSELTECHAGKGAVTGVVALGDCLACVVARCARGGEPQTPSGS